jgi:hypothetical protein
MTADVTVQTGGTQGVSGADLGAMGQTETGLDYSTLPVLAIFNGGGESAVYSARAPVAESRLRYDAERAEVELVADRNDGHYAGVHRMTALEFIARWVDQVPERYEVRVRYAGAYATRRRVWWRGRGIELAGRSGERPGSVEPEASWPALKARRGRGRRGSPGVAQAGDSTWSRAPRRAKSSLHAHGSSYPYRETTQ